MPPMILECTHSQDSLHDCKNTPIIRGHYLQEYAIFAHFEQMYQETKPFIFKMISASSNVEYSVTLSYYCKTNLSFKWGRGLIGGAKFTMMVVMIRIGTAHVPPHSLVNMNRDFRTVQFEQNLDFLKSQRFSSQLN